MLQKATTGCIVAALSPVAGNRPPLTITLSATHLIGPPWLGPSTCATVDLEVLYSARTPTEYVSIAVRRREGFTDLALVPEIGDRASAVQLQFAKKSQHRSAGIIDLITAATAENFGATMLHYDADFDHISTVTQQPTRFVVGRGSVS